MRGNHQRTDSLIRRRRSIPAYAGEPARVFVSEPVRKVYPRVCGGTRAYRAYRAYHFGLSPRMRGNPILGGMRYGIIGSIPAYAGEPRAFWAFRTLPAVYPRVCGGTASPIRALQGRHGLSPRMRGNLVAAQMRNAPVGSIPAYAGEPLPPPPLDGRATVYPRVCGGT